MVFDYRRSFSDKIVSFVKTGRALAVGPSTEAGSKRVVPFVTISQLPGAGGNEVADELIRRLNTLAVANEHWEVFDRDAIEAAAADTRISRQLIKSLEDANRTWLTDFFQGMSLRDQNPSDLRAMRKVAETIRVLAQAGRVVLVGWGSGYITTDMPGGVHVWLVAGAQDRAARLGRMLKLAPASARQELLASDERRAAFYKRYWPKRPLAPERFTLTLNSSLMDVQQMAAAIESTLIEAHPLAQTSPANLREVPHFSS